MMEDTIREAMAKTETRDVDGGRRYEVMLESGRSLEIAEHEAHLPARRRYWTVRYVQSSEEYDGDGDGDGVIGRGATGTGATVEEAVLIAADICRMKGETPIIE